MLPIATIIFVLFARHICAVVVVAAACGKCVNRVAIYAPLVASLLLPPPKNHHAVSCHFSSSTMNHVAAVALLLHHTRMCVCYTICIYRWRHGQLENLN